MLDELVGITSLYDFYAFLNIGFCILALARCFLILSFHKRLSILTETLWEGFVDIYHWVIVWITFTCIFATVFFHLLGADMEAFSSWGSSFKTLFLLVVGVGDDMDKIRSNTVGWFLVVVYAVIVTILMINLSLGIVLDAYNVHSREREESDTLPHSLTVYFYRKFQKLRHRLRHCFGFRSSASVSPETSPGRRDFVRRKTGDAMRGTY